MFPWRRLTRRAVIVALTTLATMATISFFATAVEPNIPIVAPEMAKQRSTEHRMLHRVGQQQQQQRQRQQYLSDTSSASSLQSNVPLPIVVDDLEDEGYIRLLDGQVQVSSGVDEKRLVGLMKSMYSFPLRQNQEDRRPAVELLVDLFHRRRRSFSGIDDGPEVNDSLLAADRRPLEQDDDVELLLFLSDVVDRTLYVMERRAQGESANSAATSDIGHESRLERVVDDLRAVVNASDAGPAREPARSMNIHIGEDNGTLPLWKQFENNINQYELYSKEDEPMVDELVRLLTTLPTTEVREMAFGTNLKLIFVNNDGSFGLFKPHRHDHNWEVPLEVTYWQETERHLAEIAAYHLDRTLGFRRVPPVRGVRVTFTEQMRQILPLEFQATFFESPGGNVCFFGVCKLHCDAGHAVCGTGPLVHGSLAYFLPNDGIAEWSVVMNPWKRSYINQILLADWEITEKSAGYCDVVRATTPPFDSERALVNHIDLHIFDFLQGNQDRHHSDLFTMFGNDTFLITSDNGRGFGRAHHDELSILAPLYQCCTVRLSTVKTLLDLQTSPPSSSSSSSSSSSGGGRLSDRMRRSLSSDPLSPVLSDAHLEALDRRVGIVLDQIHQCLQRSDGSRQVIVDY